MWYRVLALYSLPHDHHFKYLSLQSFLKHCRKRENAGNQNFLLFLQCFLPLKKKIFTFIVFKCLEFGPVQNLLFSKMLKHGINPIEISSLKNSYGSYNCKSMVVFVSFFKQGKQCTKKIRLYKTCRLTLIYTGHKGNSTGEL